MNPTPTRCPSCDRVVAPTAWRCSSCRHMTGHGKAVIGVIAGVVVVIAFFAVAAIWG